MNIWTVWMDQSYKVICLRSKRKRSFQNPYTPEGLIWGIRWGKSDRFCNLIATKSHLQTNCRNQVWHHPTAMRKRRKWSGGGLNCLGKCWLEQIKGIYASWWHPNVNRTKMIVLKAEIEHGLIRFNSLPVQMCKKGNFWVGNSLTRKQGSSPIDQQQSNWCKNGSSIQIWRLI